MADESQEERRKKDRIPVRFHVTYSGRNVVGTAYASNISVSGALLEEADPLLLSGGEIRMSFSLLPGSLAIELSAEVVRETENGFGVRFTGMTPRNRSLLKMAIDVAKRKQRELDAEDEEDRTLLG